MIQFSILFLYSICNGLKQYLHLNVQVDKQTLHAYDVIWVIALLIRKSIQHKSVEYFNIDYIKEGVQKPCLQIRLSK